MRMLLRRLWESPAAEVDPDDWATRFAAHMGLSAGVMIALLALLPVAPALAVSLLGYAAWEWSQWRRARLAAGLGLRAGLVRMGGHGAGCRVRGRNGCGVYADRTGDLRGGSMEEVVTSFEIDKRISLGNVLVVCGMVVSMSMGWANLSSQNSKLAADMEATSAMARANEARVRALENQTARQDERLSSILASLAKIEKLMEQAQAR